MAFANLTSVPFSTGQVAIACSHSQIGAGHIGIGFHSAKSGPQILHLAWHQKLLVDRIPDSLQTCWAAEPLSIPPLASKQIVAFVRTVAARTPKVSYGCNFISSRGSFAANGSYKPPKGSTGLTCASFVLEVLRGASVNLVNDSTWLPDHANEVWAHQVCEHLARTGADGDHIEAVRRDINGLRLRPFELAGAAQLDSNMWPANFSAVQEPAQSVEASLHGICSVPPPPTAFAAVSA